MTKKAVLVSSGQPSLNPRLIKEADALISAGYDVTVLYAYWNKWGTDFDKQLLPTKKWKAICVGGDPEFKKSTYFFSRLIYRIAQTINLKTGGKVMAEAAIARPAYFLIREAKKHKANIYIAHNLGALPAVIAAARANNKPCGFDAEDFHRHETSDDSANPEVVLKRVIEDKYLPRLNYFSASSPQIADAYRQLYPTLKPLVLLNVFPKNSAAIDKKLQNGPLKLFWFSQTIGPDRGLQDVVRALQLLDNNRFELHLLGSSRQTDAGFMKILLDSPAKIIFHEPIHPDDVIAFAGRFDIGLALENKTPHNRDICLTNKIFTYMQAGLATIASDTTAQQLLIDEHPAIGKVYPKNNPQALADILLNFYNDRQQLAALQNQALQLAQTQYNWELEALKFLNMVEQTINQHKA